MIKRRPVKERKIKDKAKHKKVREIIKDVLGSDLSNVLSSAKEYLVIRVVFWKVVEFAKAFLDKKVTIPVEEIPDFLEAFKVAREKICRYRKEEIEEEIPEIIKNVKKVVTFLKQQLAEAKKKEGER